MTDDEPTTRERLAHHLGRRGLFAALITAGGLYAVMIVQEVVITLATTISQVSSVGARAGAGSVYSLTELGPSIVQIWGQGVSQSLLTQLPFAIGVFLALWQILPIAPELRFAHVVTRALFAAAIGAAAVLVVSAVQILILAATSFSGAAFGQAASGAGRAVGTGLIGSLLHAAVTWAEEVPLVVLAGLLLWGWLQRFPPRHAVAGALDEL